MIKNKELLVVAHTDDETIEWVVLLRNILIKEMKFCYFDDDGIGARDFCEEMRKE